MTFTLSLVSNSLVVLLALIHTYIFHLEALIWHRGAARAFGVKSEHVSVTAGLAANQGYYNLILAAGLGWSVLSADWSLQLFFSGAVLCCGVFGYVTTKNTNILRAQCVPAALTLAVLFFSDASALHALGVGAVGAALVVTLGLGILVQERLKSGEAFIAKKGAGGASTTTHK